MTHLRRISAASACLLLSAVCPAVADVTLTVRDQGGERQIRLGENHVRIEDDESMIFDNEAGVIRVLQPSKQQYIEITREDLKELAGQIQSAQGQVAEAMKQAESALAMLPPEQRAMIEEKMKAAAEPPTLAGTALNLRFEKADGSETLLGAKCQKYRVLDGENLHAEAWIASPGDIGITREDLDVFHGFLTFVQSLPQEMGWQFDAFSAMDPRSEQFLGVPVRVVEMEGNTPGETFEVIAVDPSDLGPEIFAVPEGWKRVGPLDGLR